MERPVAVWIRHLSSLFLPLLTLSYVASGPHRWWEALPGLVLVVVVVLVDGRARAARHQPPTVMPGWPFTALVLALAAIQIATLLLLMRMVALGGFTLDLVLV